MRTRSTSRSFDLMEAGGGFSKGREKRGKEEGTKVFRKTADKIVRAQELGGRR